MRIKKTKIEFNQDIVNDYLSEHEDEPASVRDMAAWALQTGRWEPQRNDMISICAAELSAAARDERYIDPQGRRVRKKHVVRTTGPGSKQLYLWADIEDASPSHMRLSLSQRRPAICY